MRADPRRVLSAPDRLTFWVLGLFAVVAAVRASEPLRILLFIAAMAATIFGIAAWGSRSRVGAVVHDVISPVTCVLGAFELGGPVMNVPPDARWDRTLAALDLRFFGGLPDAWRGALGRPPWLTDIASVAYVSFFAIPIAVGAALYLRGRRRTFDRFAFSVLAGFFVPYLGYLLMPATGPRVPIELEAHLLGGTAVSAALRVFFRVAELNVLDAFPSAHTSVSLITLAFGWREFPRWRAALCFIVAAILFATVFLSFHYVIDLAAGAILALAMPFILLPLGWMCGADFFARAPQPALSVASGGSLKT